MREGIHADQVADGAVLQPSFGPTLINGAILTAAVQVAFVCSLLLWSVLLFTLRTPIQWFHVPAAALLAGGFGWWAAGALFPRERGRAFLLSYGASSLMFVCFVVVERALYDVSWDGQAYQAEAILELGRGWNPLYDSLPDGLDWGAYLTFWSKGPWITAAGIYVLTGSLEAGKAFHLMLMTSTGLLVFAAAATMAVPKRWAVLISVLLACNPVSLAQMHTFYVDGLLASLLAMTVSLLILIVHRADRVLLLLLSAVVVLTINVKLNGPVYLGIITIGFWAWYTLQQGARWRALAASLIGGGVVGGLFAGFNPYMTEFVTRLWADGYQFLLSDWMSLLLITRDSPENFAGMNRFEKVVLSLFSKSDILPTLGPSSLKIPFTVSASELHAFTVPDVRMAGYGPLFGGAALLAAAVVLVLVTRYRSGVFSSAPLVLAMLAVLSPFPNQEAWWARFAPQFWTGAALVLMAGLTCVPGRTRWLPVALGATLALNVALLFIPNATAPYEASAAVASQLAALKGRSSPVTVQFNLFAAMRHRFEREGIRYLEVDTLPCAEADRTQLAYSLTVVCNR